MPQVPVPTTAASSTGGASDAPVNVQREVLVDDAVLYITRPDTGPVLFNCTQTSDGRMVMTSKGAGKVIGHKTKHAGVVGHAWYQVEFPNRGIVQSKSSECKVDDIHAIMPEVH